MRGYQLFYGPKTGRTQFIAVERDGRMTGASDPRRDGGIAAYAAGER